MADELDDLDSLGGADPAPVPVDPGAGGAISEEEMARRRAEEAAARGGSGGGGAGGNGDKAPDREPGFPESDLTVGLLVEELVKKEAVPVAEAWGGLIAPIVVAAIVCYLAYRFSMPTVAFVAAIVFVVSVLIGLFRQTVEYPKRIKKILKMLDLDVKGFFLSLLRAEMILEAPAKFIGSPDTKADWEAKAPQLKVLYQGSASSLKEASEGYKRRYEAEGTPASQAFSPALSLGKQIVPGLVSAALITLGVGGVYLLWKGTDHRYDHDGKSLQERHPGNDALSPYDEESFGVPDQQAGWYGTRQVSPEPRRTVLDQEALDRSRARSPQAEVQSDPDVWLGR